MIKHQLNFNQKSIYIYILMVFWAGDITVFFGGNVLAKCVRFVGDVLVMFWWFVGDVYVYIYIYIKHIKVIKYTKIQNMNYGKYINNNLNFVFC